MLQNRLHTAYLLLTKRLTLILLFLCVGLSGVVAAESNNHFTTVWDGENGFCHMNIYVVTAMLDDEPLIAGDEIAVYSGELCVGAVTLSAPSNGTLINLIASFDDGSGNGFVDGDTILFKIWDASEAKEKEVLSVEYRTDLTTWSVDGKFMHNSSAFVDVVSGTIEVQRIELTQGWNIISSNVISKNANMLQVMDSLILEGSLVKVQDEAGSVVEDLGNLGGWFNAIGNFEKTEGYKVKVLRDCNLSMFGMAVDIPINIQLNEGWNIISFPMSYSVNALDILQPLIDNGILEKVKDERGNSIEDWGVYGGWINNIGDFVPGEGYEVKVKSAVVLTISSTYTKSQAIYSPASSPVYFDPCYEGNGLDHMNINVLSLSSFGLNEGDEIAVYDGDLCVGATVVTADVLNDNAAVVNVASASADDNGFAEGNLYSLKIWKGEERQELDVKPQILKGESVFSRYASSFVRLEVASPVDVVDFPQATVSVYPNPSQGLVNVKLSNMQGVSCSVEIIDIAGRQIEKRSLYSAGNHVFNLEAEQAGLYFVKTVVDGVQLLKRLVLN